MSSTIWNPYTKSYYLDCGRDGLIHVESDYIVVKLPWRYEKGPDKIVRHLRSIPWKLSHTSRLCMKFSMRVLIPTSYEASYAQLMASSFR
jgi:hypothetical protein